MTFGSCNNLAKLNAEVVAAWAEILRRVPRSRLLLKYRGLEDEGLRARYLGLFAAQGIAADRLDIEGWSPLGELLARHDGIDVALDPFPFAGGVTTCNALWMGVPVVTWPGETFASRHALSYLSTIGLTETIAGSREEYVEIAVRLASDLPRLAAIRADSSPADGRVALVRWEAAGDQFAGGFARRLAVKARGNGKFAVHRGCGWRGSRGIAPGEGGAGAGCRASTRYESPIARRLWRAQSPRPSARVLYAGVEEIRLDIDPSVSPDIVASMTDMSSVPSNSVDAVWSSHNLEHLYAHEVPLALREFRRVLKAGGLALLTTPDIQEVARHVAQGNLDGTLYVSPAGPICAIDILFGHRKQIAGGNDYMAHKTGFTAQSLEQEFREAGFADVNVRADPPSFALWARATK